jgi:type IV pilus assembly protein PilB
LGCGWVDLADVSLSPENLALLPPEVVKKFEIIPVEIKGGNVLVVAAAQPQDAEMRKELSRLTPWKLEFVIGYDGYILSAIDRYLSNSN